MTKPSDKDVLSNGARQQAEHRKKTALIGGSVAAIAGGFTALVATGVLLSSDPPTPSPETSPTMSASPSVSAPPSSYTPPGEVTIDPSLPDALPLPDGIWEETEPGWVLATYYPTVRRWDSGSDATSVEATKQVVFLIRPDGVRYQVLELDPSCLVSIESWTSGDNRAIVEVSDFDDGKCGEYPGNPLELQLETGVVLEYSTVFGEGRVVDTLAEGRRLWSARSGGTYLERDGTFTPLHGGWETGPVSPQGDLMAVSRSDDDGGGYFTGRTAIASLSTGAVTEIPDLSGDMSCEPISWIDETQFSVVCYDRVIREHRFFLVDAMEGDATETPSQIPAEDVALVNHEFQVGPGIWVGAFSGSAQERDQNYYPSVGIDDHGNLTELAILDAKGSVLEFVIAQAVVNGYLYLWGQHESGDVTGVHTVVSYDLRTGRQTVLLPEPPGGPTVGVEGSYGESPCGVTSWVVAP